MKNFCICMAIFIVCLAIVLSIRVAYYTRYEELVTIHVVNKERVGQYYLIHSENEVFICRESFDDTEQNPSEVYRKLKIGIDHLVRVRGKRCPGSGIRYRNIVEVWK